MFIRNFYSVRDGDNGHFFEEPSMAVPECSYSIKQLVSEYQIGELPNLSRLQAFIDDEEDDVEDTSNDLRFADRADAFQQISESEHLRAMVIEKVKRMRKFKEENERKNRLNLEDDPFGRGQGYQQASQEEE